MPGIAEGRGSERACKGQGTITKLAARAIMPEPATPEIDALAKALLEQGDGEAHDRALIVERLAWTPDQRLEANASFVRLYLSIRPEGPLIRE